MGTQSEPESAIPRSRDIAGSMDGGQLDSADHAILKLLQKAVGAAEANSQGALQRAAHELDAAQNRIAELKREVQHYREKSERAEDWLRKISMEIEDRLINEPEETGRQMSRRI
jgi:cell fate (sporulation/competence/biofilm development) regulator YmcA (YheA/YmcA/DUF963 family)